MRSIIAPESHEDLPSYIEASCQAFSEQVAFIQEDVTLTYGALWEKSGALAGYLQQSCSISQNDRIAIMLPNAIAFPISSVAILRAGGVQVNVNPYYTARELHHQLEDAEATVVIASAMALPALSAADPASLTTVIVVDISAKEAASELPARLKVVSLDDALNAGLIFQEGSVKLARNDIAILQYTGGTTGLSKGAMLSHGNILSNIGQFRSIGKEHFESYPLTVLTAIPLYHIFALTVNMFSMFALGVKNVLIADPRNIGRLIDQWAKYRVNFVTGVNTLFKGLLADPHFSDLPFASELLAMGGGAPVQKAVSDRWHAITGRHIREGYGLSETSPVLTCTSFVEERFLGSIGRPLPATELSVRTEEGGVAGPGEVGELCARGPQVMLGYWRRPDATASVMTADGFFRTGDMARFDENGLYYIVDRQKDMILVSGFNVYPNEVEAVVAEMPGVAECACVGCPDPSTGEAVTIFVVRKDQEMDDQQIMDYCRQNLAAYKVPRHIHFIADMPKTSVGKILRRDLRDRLLADASAVRPGAKTDAVSQVSAKAHGAVAGASS